MSLVTFFSNLLVPIIFLLILVYAFLKKVPLYDSFVEGAKEGLATVRDILPTLIGLMVATSVLRASGLLDFIAAFLKPILTPLHFPPELFPLSIMRLFSASGATGLVLDIFATYGPDSFIGRTASVMLCCTETVFYTLSVYLLSVGIRKSRYILPCALACNLAGIAASVFLVSLLF